MIPATRNVTRAFRDASDHDRRAGKAWYGEARALAATLDPADPARAAAVIAVLSPRVAWSFNVTLAHDAYAGRPLRCMTRHADKARAILAGADPDMIVTGPKVRAFWRTIADPADASTVVVDRHAIDVALGMVTDDDTRGRVVRGKGYDRVAHCYRQAARILSRESGEAWTPSEVQAATWLYWRRRKAPIPIAA
jgi:hypothetical protein